MSHTDNKPCIVCNGTKEDRTKPRIADGGHGFYPDCDSCLTPPPSVWIQTYEGKQLRIPEWNHDTISLNETATVLSRICRFGGRTRVFYSVAEHSLRVSQCVADLGGSLFEQFYALNHEGDEALLGFDPPSPMLKLLPDLRDLKRKAHESYMRRYGLPVEIPAIVKRADLILLATEKRDLMLPTPESTEWICAEEPLAKCIDQTLYDPRWRFINEWQWLAAELGVSEDAPLLHWPKQYTEISVPVSGKEPYRDGLPSEHLRAVWETWEERDTGLTDFRGTKYRRTFIDGKCDEWRPMAEISTWFDGSSGWAFRPVGATWTEVEALAAADAKP